MYDSRYDRPALDRLGEVEVIAVSREHCVAEAQDQVQAAIDLHPPGDVLAEIDSREVQGDQGEEGGSPIRLGGVQFMREL
jgi:hypothetical protein